MNTKNTLVWFVIAAGLFAAIILLNRFHRPPAVAMGNVLSGLEASTVTSLQVIPAGALEIQADRQDGFWLLTKPVSYPAQSAAVEALLAALQKLTPATRINAGELREHRAADADFGFDPPQISLVVTAGDRRWQLQVGNKTAPGDQVFLRVVGVEGAFVTDAGWLKLIPRSANDWRSTALVAADADTCDAIVLTNGAKIVELRRDPTNHLWRMIRPLPARADSDRITDALQRLLAAQAAKFVTDDPKADLTAFGLQPADLDLWLERGTNLISALHTGKNVTNETAQIYARRERWDVVFTTASSPLAPWHGTVNDFRDPHLLELTGPAGEIEVHGPLNFTLQRQGTNDWQIIGEKFPVDADTVQLFLKTLAGLRVTEFVKDVVTAPDLAAYGLTTPARQITLRLAAGGTNAAITQLDFSVQTNGIFVHRADEDFIYAISPEDFNTLFGDGSLFAAAWQFRERRIAHFSENDVAQITLHQNGKTRQLVHDGPNKWSLAPGSQGIINPPAVEETAHRLGELTVLGWLACNVTEPEKFGLKPDNLEMIVELKNGGKFSVSFGTELPRDNTALAAATLDGERWAFVFPPVAYLFVTNYLSIPANARDMRPGFWHKCRVGFRWCRISLWLVVLAGLCAVLWVNKIGLPDFLKARLVATLHERGINLEFSRMRLHFVRGIVAEQVRIGGTRTAGPVLTLAEVQLQLDFHALLRRQVQVDGLYLREGRLVWPLSPTNHLQLDNIQAALRFQTNDTWSLKHFQADFAGTKLTLTGEIGHAPELRNWEMFRGSGSLNPASWQAQLRTFSATLDRIHFTGTPHLDLAVSGDARDVHSFLIQLQAAAPAVQSPWFTARDLRLTATLTAPASAPANPGAAWGFWTNFQPYQLQWTACASQLQMNKVAAVAVAAGGFWRTPEMVVTNLSAELGGGRLDVNAGLNVATRELVFTNTSCFDVHLLDPFLNERTRQRLGQISWSQPPSLQISGALVLPAWTNAQPDWRGEVPPTLRLSGRMAATNITVHGVTIESAQVRFSRAMNYWNVSDLAIVQARTRLKLDGSEDDVTRNFHWQIRGAVDPESARPFLTDSNAANGLDLVKLAEPLVVDVVVSGRLFDWNSLAVNGRLALTNFTVRGQQFGDVAATVVYSNRVLAVLQPVAHTGTQAATADSVTLDFNAGRIYFANVLSAADPEPVVRAIGPKTWKLVEPYHFLGPPTARVNGQIPLGDLHGGPEMAAVDMRFDIIKGAPFEWLRLKTTNIVGTLHWRGQTLLLTNVAAAFYGGSADGYADFDFRVPHEGGDYHFAVNVTNVNLHTLASDLSSPTNNLEGTLAGHLVVTNASTEDLKSWRGSGRASLQNGLLWDIPIISIVSPVLNTVSPGLGNSRATEATGKFRIANGVLSTDSLEIRSTMTRLEYVGTIDLQENVNAHVTAHLLRDTWMVGPLVSTALWPVSKIFEYHVTGSLQNPKSEPIYVLPRLLLIPLHPIRTLENLFMPGGGSFTNQPPGN